MTIALAIAIPLAACIIFGLGIYFGLQHGRKVGRRNYLNGLEDGYADAIRDGWQELPSALRTQGESVGFGQECEL
ncbi:MAG TPA: hypothetical protein VNC22_14200 [Sporichthya sp.]|jgi:hypothetical protein|nr:hypothetical protein [Sporichthya sp.]